MKTLFQACFADRMSINVCGGSPQDFARLLEELLSLAPDHYSLVLLDEEVEFTSPPGVSVYRDSELAGGDFARAALRQDPDNVVLDGRAQDASETLMMARQTGHRVIAHTAVTAREAMSAREAEIRKQLPGYEAMLLNLELFVQLDESGSPGEVWQARTDQNGQPTLVLLAFRKGESWLERTPFQGFLAHVPPPSDDSPLELPEGWVARQEPLLQELRRSLGGYRKTAWGPVTSREQPADGMHFGGTARLVAGEDWPCCGSCENKMPLVVELDLGLCPEPLRQELGEDGVLQLFYCTHPRCSATQAWEAFQDNSLARVLKGLSKPSNAGPEGLLPEVAITGWESFDEGPAWEERRDLWPEENEVMGDWSWAILEMSRHPERADSLSRRFQHYFEHFQVTPQEVPELASMLGTATGDKLLGWPWWSQAPFYPTCPECARPMRMVFQLNNDGGGGEEPGWSSSLGQVFAADGNGHVFHCHGHLTFAWACG